MLLNILPCALHCLYESTTMSNIYCLLVGAHVTITTTMKRAPHALHDLMLWKDKAVQWQSIT
jgi:hypothetical protein